MPVPHACAQPHHAGSSSHRHWGSEAWESPCLRKPLTSCRGECKAVYQVPAPHNTCGSCWLGTARQFSHDMRGKGGSWFWCMCAPCFNLSFEKSKLNCTVLLHKEFEIPTLRIKFFEILKFVFLSEFAHKSFCVKFSGLISKLKILEKSY